MYFLSRLLEGYHAKGKKFYVCYMDLEKALDRVPRKELEWAMRKIGIPEVLARSMMSLYDSSLIIMSEEFKVEVGMHQGSVLSPFLFAVVLDVACL